MLVQSTNGTPQVCTKENSDKAKFKWLKLVVYSDCNLLHIKILNEKSLLQVFGNAAYHFEFDSERFRIWLTNAFPIIVQASHVLLL